ncbi:unnamed protein product [marine sediment metagenome]|uniref:Uncharacterized protein n=1 Tax=marine sediment metagenome TaxID=412755 RepID=X1U3Y3_9ZZZZ
MRDKFIKVKLYGLGWDKGAKSVDEAYRELQAELFTKLKGDVRYVAQLKTVEIAICQELDKLHYISDEGEKLLVVQ